MSEFGRMMDEKDEQISALQAEVERLREACMVVMADRFRAEERERLLRAEIRPLTALCKELEHFADLCDALKRENEALTAQLSWVHAVACGEEQIASDDTDALRIIFEALDITVNAALDAAKEPAKS